MRTTRFNCTRRPGESIVINGNVRVTVDTKASVTVEAPVNVTVDRGEVYARKMTREEAAVAIVAASVVASGSHGCADTEEA